MTDACAAGEQSDDDLRIRVAFDILKEHSRSFFGRAFDGTARADVTVYTGEFGHRIDFDVSRKKLVRKLA